MGKDPAPPHGRIWAVPGTRRKNDIPGHPAGKACLNGRDSQLGWVCGSRPAAGILALSASGRMAAGATEGIGVAKGSAGLLPGMCNG